MHNEDLAIEQIKSMPKDVKMHLSHVLRNRLCCIKGAIALIERQLEQCEKEMREMGL
ncbi:MAG: hypothetical protein NUW09_11290 [Deltaproteobacteria bacterium]|nr:hypothetical protein [Deltaproteobacteria bacterium]